MKKIEKFEKIEDPASNLDAELQNLPQSPGVYLFKGENAKLLYVGKAKVLKNRVRSYFQNSADHGPRILHLVSNIKSLEYLTTGTEVEALLLENSLIKKLKPKYNIRLRDDKTYPYIRIDMGHSSPRAYVARRQQADSQNEYFGPFPDSSGVRRIIAISSKVFQLRDCRDHDFANRSRPCLSYQMGQCTAPCVNLVSPDAYLKQVEDFKAFLKGSSGNLMEHIEGQMLEASEKLEFEKAARLRDQLQAIRSVTQQNQRIVQTEDHVDKDVWAFWPFELPSLEADQGPGSVHLLNLQFRSGKLVGRVYRRADLAEALPSEDWALELLYQFYAKNPIPTQILLPDFFGKNALEALSSLLEGLHGEEKNQATLHLVSEKAEWLSLFELALENVKEAHRVAEEARQKQEDAHRELARLLELEKIPVRLECVDISNFQGSENVASAVVFLGGRPAKAEYRKYLIKGVVGQDDFASMREVMSRRYGKTDSPRPDLLVIDGGRGQLGAVVEILNALGCHFPVVGLAKARTQSNFQSSDVESSEERFFIPGQKNPLKIRNKAVLNLMSSLRDEAHRFAIEYHRQRRDKIPT